MTACAAIIAAIITIETALTYGTKTVETADVPETDGTVRFVWPKEKVPASFTSVTVTPDFATARKGEEVHRTLRGHPHRLPFPESCLYEAF